MACGAQDDAEPTSEEKLVMQSTNASLDQVRDAMTMLAGDVDYAIEYIIATNNAAEEEEELKRAAAASAPHDHDGAGAGAGTGAGAGAGADAGAHAASVAAGAGAGAADVGAGGSVGGAGIAAGNANLTEEQALAVAMQQSLKETEEKAARHAAAAEAPKKKAAPEINKSDPCPCGSGKKYSKCCRKRVKHAERLYVDSLGGTSVALLRCVGHDGRSRTLDMHRDGAGPRRLAQGR